MEAYLALATCIALIALAAVITTAVIQGERIRHLEAMNAKRRKAIRPFDHDGDGMPGGNIDPYVKRALDRLREQQPLGVQRQ